MGLILDSSVLIAAERRKQSVSDLLMSVTETTGFEAIMLSAVGVIELEHGYWRANTPELAARRRAWLDEVFTALPVEPFTKEMGQMAARIDVPTAVTTPTSLRSSSNGNDTADKAKAHSANRKPTPTPAPINVQPRSVRNRSRANRVIDAG